MQIESDTDDAGPASVCAVPPWMTVDQVAADLGLKTKAAVYRLIKEEGLPAWNVGSSRRPIYRIDREELIEWAHSRHVTPETPREEP